MTDAEIAGYMNWRGPGAYTAHHMKRIKRIIEEVQRREREACAKVCDTMATPETSRDAQHDFHWAAGCCAAAIRARGQA